MSKNKLTIITAALFLMMTFGSALTSAQTPDLRPLTTGQVIERELKGDEAHSYSLTLAAGQYLNVVVEQKGIDVVVVLFDANGKKLVEVDSLNEAQGTEPITLFIEIAGNYRLEVRSPEKTVAGRYEVKIKELRAATEKDKNKISAQKAFAEGEVLELQRKAESLRDAIKKYEEALLFYRAAGDKGGEAAALNNIGAAYLALGEKQKALEYLSQALQLRRVGDDRGDEAETLSNIGFFYSNLGDQQKALEYYSQALQLLRAVGDREGEAITRNNIGGVYNALGEKQKALEYYLQSLQLRRVVGDKVGEANTLNNIGGVYDELGEKQKALEYYLQALQLRRAVGDRRGEAAAFHNIGGVYDALGEKQKALEYLSQAVQLLRAVGDRRSEAQTLNNIGLVYAALGEQQKALEYYLQSLQLRRIVGDRRGEAVTLNNIGGIYNALGEKQKTLEYYLQALPLRRAVSDRRGEANTLDNLSIFWSNSNNHRFAVAYGKLSVSNYQLLRGNITGLDKNVQQTFLKSVEKTYRQLADSLLAQNRYAEAQQVLNSFKDQQFFDFSQSKSLAPLAVTVREDELTANLNQKLENVVAAIRAVDAFKRGIGARQPTADETAQLKVLIDKQTVANDDYLAFLKSAEKEFAAPPTEKDKAPVVSDLTELQTALRKLSAETGEKSVAVYTLVGVDNYRALIITSDSIFAVSTPIKGAVLNEKARQLWSLLRTPEFNPQPLAREVYDAVFAPLAAKLPADTKTILWSLDGKLRYLPMAVLHDGKGYLVERYNNVVFTRADTERLTRSVSANRNGTVFGASEERLVKIGGENFPAWALPFVKTELARIFKTGNSTNGVLSGEVLLNEQFTRAAMISTLQKRRPFVHIASHFAFVPGDEAKSFLLLGDGSPFTLDEMKQEKNLFDGVELLALSACETAAQRESSDGREVDGFAELAQRLGAGAVMASLWEVSDKSTAELMARFYKTYDNQKGANKASSLRAAQLAILRGDFKGASLISRQVTLTDAEVKAKIKIDPAKQKPFVAGKNAPFAHPFYWSPFILIGNWK